MSQHGYTLQLEHPCDGVALLRFADAQRANQLCWAAVDEMADRLAECREQSVRVVVLASDLEGHWLQHAWLRDLDHGLGGEPTTSSGGGWFRVIRELSQAPLVSIAAVSGDTSGGGCEIGWACDLRVAEIQARFAQPEIRLGIPPGVGGVSRLSALVGRSLASEMVLGGHWTSAQRVFDAGALNRLVGAGTALPAALEWAAQLAAQPPAALAACKQILAAAPELPLTEALANEQNIFQLTASDARSRALIQAQQRFYDAGGTTAESFSEPN
jgi:enoyl-CoA hydratase/carnithine racemase